ncbi:unnamed protein product, partial [Amoebophrya sp. A25]|eukprot:GSA25T00024969001.1
MVDLNHERPANDVDSEDVSDIKMAPGQAAKGGGPSKEHEPLEFSRRNTSVKRESGKMQKEASETHHGGNHETSNSGAVNRPASELDRSRISVTLSQSTLSRSLPPGMTEVQPPPLPPGFQTGGSSSSTKKEKHKKERKAAPRRGWSHGASSSHAAPHVEDPDDKKKKLNASDYYLPESVSTTPKSKNQAWTDEGGQNHDRKNQSSASTKESTIGHGLGGVSVGGGGAEAEHRPRKSVSVGPEDSFNYPDEADPPQKKLVLADYASSSSASSSKGCKTKQRPKTSRKARPAEDQVARAGRLAERVESMSAASRPTTAPASRRTGVADAEDTAGGAGGDLPRQQRTSRDRPDWRDKKQLPGSG